METNASSKCTVCGKDTPHVHDLIIQGYMTKVERLNAKVLELKDWKANAMRFDETNLLLRKKVAELTQERDRANALLKRCGWFVRDNEGTGKEAILAAIAKYQNQKGGD